jgi:hypothetical protein
MLSDLELFLNTLYIGVPIRPESLNALSDTNIGLDVLRILELLDDITNTVGCLIIDNIKITEVSDSICQLRLTVTESI